MLKQIDKNRKAGLHRLCKGIRLFFYVLLVLYLSFRHGLQMPSVRAFSIGFRAFHELFLVNEPIDISNLFRCRNDDALAVLDVFEEVCHLQKRGYGPGVQPGESAAEDLHVQQAVLQIHFVECGDLELAAGRGLHFVRPLRHAGRIEIQAGHGIVALHSLFLSIENPKAFNSLHISSFQLSLSETPMPCKSEGSSTPFSEIIITRSRPSFPMK